MSVIEQPWWKDAVVYQIYPASFKDSNGDGIGDLPGILSELDYIKELGADVIWICPMYDSPQKDMGYDISDYENIYPPYGTLEDMERIIAGCHERGMKVILDLVINHTSDQHAWFRESRSSRDNPKRDWYVWRPAKYDAQGNRQPPNNWAGFFGGSAWQWDELTQEYYLHLFCPEQPDFNFENDAARAAIFESSMHFWLRKGVDGFRIDTVNLYSKAPGLPDAPIVHPTKPYQVDITLVCNGPRMREYLSEMHNILSQYGTTMTVGELAATHGRESVLRYVSAAQKQINMAIQFDIVNVGVAKDMLHRYNVVPGENWTLPDFTTAVAEIQELLQDSDGWVTAFLENHDQARSVSRWGSDTTEENRVRSAKLLALLLGTLSGTMFVYQGQEIGMVNVPQDWPIEEYLDVASINYYNEVTQSIDGDNTEAKARALRSLQHLARDNSRIPFSWDETPNAGFTVADQKPWMRVHDNHKQVNARSQINNPDSVLSFWKRIIRTRKANADVLIHGYYEGVQDKDLNVYIYTKKCPKRTAIVALNFSDKEQKLDIPILAKGSDVELVMGTYGDAVDGKLRPFEGRVWIMDNARSQL